MAIEEGKSKLTIRRAIPGDEKTILELIQGLADFEKEPCQVTATLTDIKRSFFPDPETSHVPSVFCEILDEVSADDESVISSGCGFAVWFLNYSTWQGKHGIYLEDLFVKEPFRGRGYGKAVLTYLAGICVEKGYGRFQWSVLDWNSPAIEFYCGLGAKPLDEWTVYRVEGDSLNALAESLNHPVDESLK